MAWASSEPPRGCVMRHDARAVHYMRLVPRKVVRLKPANWTGGYGPVEESNSYAVDCIHVQASKLYNGYSRSFQSPNQWTISQVDLLCQTIYLQPTVLPYSGFISREKSLDILTSKLLPSLPIQFASSLISANECKCGVKGAS